MLRVPIPIGMMLCEQVIVQEQTRYVTPVNCFTHRTVKQFPSEAFPFVAFSILTGAQGDVPLAIVINRLDTLEPVYRTDFSVRFTSPLQAVRCTLRVLNCRFPVAGHYEVLLMAGGEMLARVKLVIQQKEPSP